MKKIWILCMAAFLVFGFVSGASADTIYNNPNPVQFISNEDAGLITGAANIGLSYEPNGTYNLEFKVGAGSWTPYDPTGVLVANSTNIAVPDGGIVSLRMIDTSNPQSPIYQALKMTFKGENTVLYPGHYDNIFVKWLAGVDTTVVSNSDGGSNLSPVPLPGAVWLLSSGLLGLVSIRRRFSI